MRALYFGMGILILTIGAMACGEAEAVSPDEGLTTESETMRPPPNPNKPRPEQPEAVTVDHILIAFRGSGVEVSRGKDEARALAYKIYWDAKNSDEFRALAQKYSDDRQNDTAGGPYAMVNSTNPSQKGPDGEYSRAGMVPAFGDVGFVLEIDEIGIAEFDAEKSPYGWHIIKRVK